MTSHSPSALICPPECWRADSPEDHTLEVENGRAVIVHEARFGPQVFGAMRQDVRTDEVVELYIGIIDVEDAIAADGLQSRPDMLRALSAALLDASDWLEARQAEHGTPVR